MLHFYCIIGLTKAYTTAIIYTFFRSASSSITRPGKKIVNQKVSELVELLCIVLTDQL